MSPPSSHSEVEKDREGLEASNKFGFSSRPPRCSPGWPARHEHSHFLRSLACSLSSCCHPPQRFLDQMLWKSGKFIAQRAGAGMLTVRQTRSATYEQERTKTKFIQVEIPCMSTRASPNGVAPAQVSSRTCKKVFFLDARTRLGNSHLSH
jgi:hypothetical protein